MVLAACASQPLRWTPETVATPGTPPAGIEKAAPLRERAEAVRPDAAEQDKPVPLSRDAALLTALLQNRSLEVARLGPQIGDTYIPEARAAFDPSISASISTGRDRRLLSSTGSSTLGSGSTPSIIGTGAGQLAALQATIGALEQMLAAAKALDESGRPVQDTKDTQGDITVQEYLPTGAQVYLRGAASATDTNMTANDYQGSWSVGFNQSLLRGAGARVNLISLKQAGNRAAQSRHAFRGAVLETTHQVELAYWNLVLAYEVFKIREFALTLAEEQLKRDEDRLAVGKAIEGDVMASRAERATRTADLYDARAGVRNQTIALIHLLNPDLADPWNLTLEPTNPPEAAQAPVSPDESVDLARKYRPELAEARLDLANADLETTRAKNGLLPQLDVVGSYGRMSRDESKSGITKYLDDGDFENYRIGLEFQTPIFRRAEEARHKRARLLQTQAERTVASVEQAIEAEVRQAAVEVEKQWERIGATHEAVESRTEQLRVAQGRNEVGKTTNLDVLIVQRDLVQSKLDDVTARIEYVEALTSLYAAEGTLLERRGIALESDEDES